MTTEQRAILLGHASDLESGHHGLPGVATSGGRLYQGDGFQYVVEELPTGTRPLKKPSPRTLGLRRLTNEELRRIAAMNPPPAVWFDEDQEIPFA